MFDVLSESIVSCRNLWDVACSGHCAIPVTLNFDQRMPMTHSTEGQNAKRINWNLKMLDLNDSFM